MTASRVGEQLFSDPILSSNGKVSCATCHVPEHGYASDGLAPRLGGGLLDRRAPSLYDRGDGKAFFWDGRAKTLEEQAILVIGHPREMGGPLEAAVRRAKAKYGEVDVVGSIVAFERTLKSPRTRFDDYIEGKNTLALSDSEARGWDLFRGKAECYRCHTRQSPFTDEQLHDTGLDGRFKTPGLRGVRLTGPYFHDASGLDLRSVINHYDQGGGEAKTLHLTPRERDDLEAFLKSL